MIALSLLVSFLGCDAAKPKVDRDSEGSADNGGDDSPTGLVEGDACDPAADLCPETTACCTECCESDKTPVCTLTEEDACPLPDLSVDQPRLEAGMFEEWRYFEEDDCAIVEGCVVSSGWRRLLRFDLTTPNYGTADLRFGDPTDNPLFHYSECHRHFHFDGYAAYSLQDAEANEVAAGHKQAFCLLDYEPWTEDARNRGQYTCENQGISEGWADTYGSYLDCQWVDITDVPAGTYALHTAVNIDNVLPELDYTNNSADANYTVIDPAEMPAVTEACSGTGEGDSRDCGWTLAGNFTCTPGEPVDVACSGACEGTCVGDPVMRVCDGADNPCFSYQALGSADDTCDKCPVVPVTCPAGGVVTVLTGEWSTDDGLATCDVVLE